jgi:prepilin-type processing-associated H-X9-DG protein
MRGEGGSGLERPVGQPEERLLPTCSRGLECMGDRVNAEGGCLCFCTSCGVLIARLECLAACCPQTYPNLLSARAGATPVGWCDGHVMGRATLRGCCLLQCAWSLATHPHTSPLWSVARAINCSSSSSSTSEWSAASCHVAGLPGVPSGRC